MLAIGLMSGTSFDGVDAALLETDGEKLVQPREWLTVPYEKSLRHRLKHLITDQSDLAEVEKAITITHIEAVEQLLEQTKLAKSDIEVIGFHGQTIAHKPHEAFTWQIGDGPFLAKKTGIDVVYDFRKADMTMGGQGAPLIPIYHQAIMANESKPVAVLNIGGISNVTWIGEGNNSLLAFDTGPGNALLDDWVNQHTDEHYDKDGIYASKGKVYEDIIEGILANPFFDYTPPKSLDRTDFSSSQLESLSLEDGAATLTALTAASVARAIPYFPDSPSRWYVTGGGRHNATMMRMLKDYLQCRVRPIEDAGFDGDALEAQGFAYLAVRSLLGLPLSHPSTTGAKMSVTGGVVCRA